MDSGAGWAMVHRVSTRVGHDWSDLACMHSSLYTNSSLLHISKSSSGHFSVLTLLNSSGVDNSLFKILPSPVFYDAQFSSVAQLCLTLCDSMNCSTPGLPVHHQLLKLTSIKLVMPSSHLILCHPLLLLPPIPPSIWVFSNESTLRMRWPKYWSLSFSIIPSKEHPGLISFRMDWLISLQSKGLSRVFSNTTVQKHQFFDAQLSSQSNSHIHTWPLEKP